MSQYSKSGPRRSILSSKAVPIESAGPAANVAERVREGKAFLKVVETPWGVEFYVVDAGATA